ncbi:type I glyceraldehyde-3-phosphate dehydrogenase [Candidatus Amesbacteria bacterium RBG_16_48_31]|nr:MAG: type I glyceraldehyde-3-phosphate dehydrogenase [Candidatus Amesbacteria bacterium RBG_16_48_31]
MVKVAINGFGRIGRLAFRIGLLKHHNEMEFAAVNTSGSMEVEGWRHLVMQDTTYRRFEIEIRSERVKKVSEATDSDPLIGYLVVDSMGLRIPVLAQRDPEKLPWSKYGVEVVMECTGKFTDEAGAIKHARAGAKRVVISAPSRGGNVGTYVLGVNASEIQNEGVVISNASCTTNCVTPIAAVIHKKFGVVKAMMTTVHAYTDDQVLQDGSHKDLRRARAAAANIVPTSTGAAIATTEVIPELKGLFDGISLRVPVLTGSIADFVFVTSRKTTREEVNQALVTASGNPIYKGIIGVAGVNGIPEYLVSSDVIGSSYSAIVDPEFTQVIDGDLVKVLAWYDNEWGYAHRLVEQVIRVGEAMGSDRAISDPITMSLTVAK